MNKTFFSNVDRLSNGIFYLDRPRINNLLENAADYPIIVVYAGAGYGKTRAVYQYLQETEAKVVWVQITEQDNIVTHFWENFTGVVSQLWPEVGERFKQIGYPDTDESFAKFATLRREMLADQGKCYFVYDDFQLITNPVLLQGFAKIVSSLPASGTAILISRTIPDINMTSMMLREHIFAIREETLSFTEDEIAAYFKQLNASVTRQDIHDVFIDTQGWAFAVNLVGRSLLENRRYERHILRAMKENVYKLIETEVLDTISEELLHFLLKVSLIDRIDADLIRTLAGDEQIVEEFERLNAYVRYDFNLGIYHIHNLFMESISNKQYLLTEEEKQSTYHIAAEWCEENGYQTDALIYYKKSGDWNSILRITYMLEFPTSQHMAVFLSDIFADVPDEVTENNIYYPVIVIKTVTCMGDLEAASELAAKYAKEYESRPETDDNNRALAKIYGAWGIVMMLRCCVVDEYNFAPYFEKMRMYHDRNPEIAEGPMTSVIIGSYVTLVGTNRAGAVEEFIDALSESIPNLSYAMGGYLTGGDDLARGEICFFRRELSNAEQYISVALDKARNSNQYDIQNRSLLYLMLIALSKGDIRAADGYLQMMEELLDVKDYTVRYEAYDIAKSHYYLALGMPEMIQDWLKADFSTFAHPAFLENYANRIKAQHRYMTRQYNTLLAFLDNLPDNRTLIIGRIVFKIIKALTLYKLKRQQEAIDVLTEAYYLAEPNRFITPFAQYGKDMRTLTAAALRNEKCEIPREWLEDINRKSSAFAKRQSYLITEYRSLNNIEKKVNLTNREIDILRDLSQGLSRTEIAASRNISANTVKAATNIIYEKLHANSLADAIRIAAERKIL